MFPGKKMAGQLGNVTRTVQNLIVVRVDAERQLLLVRGSVPGHAGRDIIVRPAVKPQKVRQQQAKPAAGKDEKPAAKKEQPAAKPKEAAAKPAPKA